MGVLSQGELWKDFNEETPPPQWELLGDPDSTWYFYDLQHNLADSNSRIIYIGEEPLPATLTWTYEIQSGSVHTPVNFFYNLGGNTVIVPLTGGEPGSGSGTVTVDTTGYTEFYWGISCNDANLPPYTYGLFMVLTEGEEAPPEEPDPEGQYYEVKYLPVDEFVKRCNSRVVTDDNVVITTYGPDDVQLTIVTNQAPTYWTSIDDDYIIFDSYDSAVESNILANNTQVFVDRDPVFELTDEHVINLPSNLTQYLQAQAEAYCMAVIKQMPNVKSEQKERRLRVRSMRNKWRHQRLIQEGPNFGR